MLWWIIEMLLILGVVSFFASSAMLGGAIQILLISALGALGVKPMGAVPSRIRSYQGD